VKYCQNEGAVLWKGLHNIKEACQHIWLGHIKNVVPGLFFYLKPYIYQTAYYILSGVMQSMAHFFCSQKKKKKNPTHFLLLFFF